MKVVTYTIRQGPIELFAIDPQTGVIKTIRGLDYEKENQHTLLIGTVENQSNDPGAITRVIVQVEVSHRLITYSSLITFSNCQDI